MAEDTPAVEVKSKADDAWFEAHLAHDAAAKQLQVKVPGFDEENETVVGKDDVLARVRWPAEQVPDKKCAEVKVGDVMSVLNNTDTSSRYFDATVEKIERHDHATRLGREICQCEFLVKWSAGPDKGETSVVGCECLCVINTTPIHTHPVVAEYLASLG